MAQQQAVTPSNGNGENLPATSPTSSLMEKMQRAAGAGVSTKASDNLIPNIRVLQSQTPMVLEGKGKAGDFLMPSGEVISGTEGFWFQPAHQGHIWLEFRQREAGGGFVAQHPYRGEDERGEAIPPDGTEQYGQFKYRMKGSGNDVSHWRQWVGIVWEEGNGLEHVLSLTSSGHTVARQWMSTSRMANRLPDGKARPLWGQVYKITTYPKRTNKGSWHMVGVSAPIPLEQAGDIVRDPDTAFDVGESLHLAFVEGTKIVRTEDMADAHDE